MTTTVLIVGVISFIVGGFFMLGCTSMVSMSKPKPCLYGTPLFVTKDECYNENELTLWFGRPVLVDGSFTSQNERKVFVMAFKRTFDLYNLNPDDFSDMKAGEIRPVFLKPKD